MDLFKKAIVRPAEEGEKGALAVPFESVIDTGSKKIVYVDRGKGVFEGVDVRLGHRAGDYYEVYEGLAEGDRVVTAGAFLLDAEANLTGLAGSYFGAVEK